MGRTKDSDAVKKTEPESVDDYLAALPEDKRAALKKLREFIRAAVPNAEELISYQIPAYRYRGKPLVSFAAFKEHCTFFVGTDVMRAHAADLKGYDVTKSGLHFPTNEPLPAALVKRLVKARITAIENRASDNG